MRKNHISSHPNWYVQYCCKIYITHDKMQYILLPLHLYSKLFSKVINASYFKSFFLFVRIFLAQKRSGNQCGCYLSSNYIILFNPPTAIYWSIFLVFFIFYFICFPYNFLLAVSVDHKQGFYRLARESVQKLPKIIQHFSSFTLVRNDHCYKDQE